MADAMRTLPDAELEVMQAIWACEEPVKRAAISAILDRTHPMAPTTLLTVLSRLADKGFVRIEDRPQRRIPAAGRKRGLSCPAGAEILR